MKKKYVLLVSSFFLFVSFISPKKNIYQSIPDIINVDGKSLTVSKGCTLCHHPEKQIVGPSFKNIANKYNSNASEILNFLNGNSNPIVDPEEFQYMKPVLSQLKHTSKEEKEAIAKYIATLN